MSVIKFLILIFSLILLYILCSYLLSSYKRSERIKIYQDNAQLIDSAATCISNNYKEIDSLLRGVTLDEISLTLETVKEHKTLKFRLLPVLNLFNKTPIKHINVVSSDCFYTELSYEAFTFYNLYYILAFSSDKGCDILIRNIRYYGDVISFEKKLNGNWKYQEMSRYTGT